MQLPMISYMKKVDRWFKCFYGIPWADSGDVYENLKSARDEDVSPKQYVLYFYDKKKPLADPPERSKHV
jgi:hypothetical protein